MRDRLVAQLAIKRAKLARLGTGEVGRRYARSASAMTASRCRGSAATSSRRNAAARSLIGLRIGSKTLGSASWLAYSRSCRNASTSVDRVLAHEMQLGPEPVDLGGLGLVEHQPSQVVVLAIEKRERDDLVDRHDLGVAKGRREDLADRVETPIRTGAAPAEPSRNDDRQLGHDSRAMLWAARQATATARSLRAGASLPARRRSQARSPQPGRPARRTSSTSGACTPMLAASIAAPPGCLPKRAGSSPIGRR